MKIPCGIAVTYGVERWSVPIITKNTRTKQHTYTMETIKNAANYGTSLFPPSSSISLHFPLSFRCTTRSFFSCNDSLRVHPRICRWCLQRGQQGGRQGLWCLCRNQIERRSWCRQGQDGRVKPRRQGWGLQAKGHPLNSISSITTLI